jgi:enoyl-CoA hydratase
MPEPDHLIIEYPAPSVLLLRLNRPPRRNALTAALVIDLARRLSEAAASPDIRVVVLTGDDKAFSAGADIHEMNERGVAAILDTRRLSAWRSIEAFPKPMIAAVRGVAFGAGNELAMLADLIVAGHGARFAQPEVKIGGLAGDGGTQRLPRLVGRQQAAKMLLTGEPVGGAEAKAIGLVCEVAEDEKVVAMAIQLAENIARNAPLSLAATKKLIRQSDETGLADALRIERDFLLDLFQSADRVEGMTAFAEKRLPKWQEK